MEIVIACMVAFYFVKNGVIDTAYAVRGKPSPRQPLARQLVQAHNNRSRRTGDSPFGKYVRRLWDDSWDDARNRHVRRRDKRRARREERDAGQHPNGAARRYLTGVKSDLRARWDRGWDNANTKRHNRLLAGQAQRTAAASIAAAVPARVNPAPASEATKEPERELHTTQDSAGPSGGSASTRGLAAVRPLDEPTTQEEPAVTATSGETTTLSQTLSAIQAWETSTRDAMTSLETSIASLQGAEVGTPVTGPLSQAHEAFGQALTAFQAAFDGLSSSVQIGDMYQSSPEAGSKDYVTS
jgi:hypothetical protein